MNQIFIGSNNPGKLKEFSDSLSKLNIRIINPKMLDLSPEIPETGQTFAENATQKAKAWAELSHLPTLVDDSGLCVDALGGKPGIYSARFIKGSDLDRNNEILKLLKDVPENKRTAHYSCVIAFYDPLKQTKHLTEGICEGHILEHAQGSGGFGYDPIFQPLGYKLSFGQLSMDVKQQISHRAKALASMVDYLREWNR